MHFTEDFDVIIVIRVARTWHFVLLGVAAVIIIVITFIMDGTGSVVNIIIVVAICTDIVGFITLCSAVCRTIVGVNVSLNFWMKRVQQFSFSCVTYERGRRFCCCGLCGGHCISFSDLLLACVRCSVCKRSSKQRGRRLTRRAERVACTMWRFVGMNNNA